MVSPHRETNPNGFATVVSKQVNDPNKRETDKELDCWNSGRHGEGHTLNGQYDYET